MEIVFGELNKAQNPRISFNNYENDRDGVFLGSVIEKDAKPFLMHISKIKCLGEGAHKGASQFSPRF